ncbi:MAG: BON domain-containing protein [Chloroflexota bacterium]
MFRFDDDLPEAERHLLTAIRKTLWDYEPLRATRPILDISVRDGLVRLQGRVRTAAIKEISEFLLHRIPGIRAVRNDLVADPEVVRAVADAIAADPELGPACPIIESRDGEVILVGQVASQELARRATEIATAVPIVASVANHLHVTPPALAHSTNGAVAVATGEQEPV